MEVRALASRRSSGATRSHLPFLVTLAVVATAQVSTDLVSTALARAQPEPLGPAVAIDREAGLHFQCPQLAGRGDGSFVALWPRVDVGSGGETATRLLLSRANTEGDVVAVDAVDSRPGASGIAVEGIAANPTAYTALWLRALPAFRRAHVALALEEDGTAVGAPRRLARAGMAWSPRPAGGFVAYSTSEQSRKRLQLLDPEGTPIAPGVDLPASELLQTVHRPDGRFVALWQAFGRDRNGRRDLGVMAQRFDAVGRRIGAPLRVVPARRDPYRTRWLAALGADGTLAVVTASEETLRAVDAIGEVTLRTFDGTGHPLGSLALTTREQMAAEVSYPTGVTVDTRGHVLVLWAQYPHFDAASVRARVTARDATALGDVFTVYGKADDLHSTLVCGTATWAYQSWVVVWTAPVAAGEDAEQVFVRRFADE